MTKMTARHIQPGDHINGTVICSSRPLDDGGREFHVTEPFTANSYDITVSGDKLDLVTFEVTKRGDDHNPNPRNRELGLPEVPPKVYVAPEPIAVYPVGTRVADVNEFDRGQKVVFECPIHGNRFFSKDPYVSNWFGETSCPSDCLVVTGDHRLVEEYKPTRNG